MTARDAASSVLSTPFAGLWKLAGGRAITLIPVHDGELRIACGGVWATFDGPHDGAMPCRGDVFVEAGGVLPVHAGERLVIEPTRPHEPVYFDWQPVVAVAPGMADLRKPLREVGLGLRLAMGASGRLIVALARWGWMTIVPRPAGRGGVSQPA